MRIIKLPLGLILALCIFSGSAVAEDWPQWRGPERNGHIPAGQAVPTSLPESPKVVWHIPQGNGVSSPVVSGGKVFFLDAGETMEMVHAANASDGSVLWSVPLDDLHKDSQSAAGPRCTPLVDGDRVYAQSCRGELQCLGTDDGKVIWRTNYVKDFGAIFIGEKGKADGASRHGNTGSPLIDGDHLIAEVGGKDGASIVAFDKKTGDIVWKSGNSTPGYAASIVATVGGQRQVIAFMADGLLGLDRVDGKPLWHIPLKTGFARHVTTPVVIGDIVMVASHQIGLVGVKLAKTADGIGAETAWTLKDAAFNFSSPVAKDQYIYGLGPNKNLLCIDSQTGKQAWSKDGFLNGKADKAEVGMIVAGDNLLILTDEGQLVLAAADPKAYHEISRVRVSIDNWCNPAYADGRLYLRDKNELLCVDLIH
jgi:outer membrane protein assembly factor BamB